MAEQLLDAPSLGLVLLQTFIQEVPEEIREFV